MQYPLRKIDTRQLWAQLEELDRELTHSRDIWSDSTRDAFDDLFWDSIYKDLRFFIEELALLMEELEQIQNAILQLS